MTAQPLTVIPGGFPKAKMPSLLQRVRLATEAVQAVGGTVAAVEISAEGAVRVLTTAGAPPVSETRLTNEWDEVLPPR